MGVSTTIEKNFSIDYHTEDANSDKDKINLFTLNEQVFKRVKEINKDAIFENYTVHEKHSDEELDPISAFQTPNFLINFQQFHRSIYFSKTQKWVGHILEINKDVITAKLDDINNPTTHEIAEFDIDEVPPEDRELISKGAGFYWSLGQVNDNGQIEKKSMIRFQRTKLWEEEDVNQIIDTADNLYNKLNNWD